MRGVGTESSGERHKGGTLISNCQPQGRLHGS